MRFFFDNDVDAQVCAELRVRGHECWFARDAGLSEADDDDLAVYADDHSAVMVTHDREFTTRRANSSSPFGKHIRLSCNNTNAVEVMMEQLDETLTRLEQLEVCVLVVSKERVRVKYPAWSG